MKTRLVLLELFRARARVRAEPDPIPAPGLAARPPAAGRFGVGGTSVGTGGVPTRAAARRGEHAAPAVWPGAAGATGGQGSGGNGGRTPATTGGGAGGTRRQRWRAPARRGRRDSAAPPATNGVAAFAVTTNRYDNLRSGANLQETTLTRPTSRPTHSACCSRAPSTARCYAQPLFVGGLTMADQKVHDVVYVATEHNTRLRVRRRRPAADRAAVDAERRAVRLQQLRQPVAGDWHHRDAGHRPGGGRHLLHLQGTGGRGLGPAHPRRQHRHRRRASRAHPRSSRRRSTGTGAGSSGGKSRSIPRRS